MSFSDTDPDSRYNFTEMSILQHTTINWTFIHHIYFYRNVLDVNEKFFIFTHPIMSFSNIHLLPCLHIALLVD